MVPMVAASPLMRIKAINGITKKLIYFDLFLITGMLPTDWKLARVVPIPKLGYSKDPANDRLISILPVLQKNTFY